MTRKRLSWTWLLIAPAAVLLGVFLLVPYLNIVLMSFRPPATGAPYGPGLTLGNYERALTDGYYLGQLGSTLWIALLTTAATLLVGFPVAWQLARSRSRWRPVLYGIVLSPLLVGIVVRSFGWTILLGNNGVINKAVRSLGLTLAPLPLMYNTLGIVVALTHVFLPFMILPVMASLQTIDPALEAAGRSLGATRRVAFRRIVLPLALPGIQSGCILVFVLALSAYVTPVLIGGMRVKTMTLTVVDTLTDAFQWPLGSALALMLSVAGGLCVVLFARATRMRWAS
ncbi:putative spermidine/putrescine transport system permease protein [Inquilinus ginsengisoli]|uniref:Spermidine/putrescine transport system permease protein n=1 Tax=Inquilinus ginsengisoli TaxID=363840 RepID=A0ABU1K1V0_9PROT|nr:ABC transporter permease [Inquilinus ginsengisoli]MDR6294492.1 putative spermidine/putrescine transport system permease protein [Inquilinus ginsengisoli]